VENFWDKSTKLTASQLAGEDAFVRYVLFGEDREKWDTWQTERPERKALVEEARYITKMLSGFSPDQMSDHERNEVWDKVKSSITADQKKTRFRKQYRLLRWSLAAAATFALVIWFVTNHQVNNVITRATEKEEVHLPDESVVTVNAGSLVKYNHAKFKVERVIRLEGEAFFNVHPGSKFSVVTPQGTVTVMGTSFNVIARPDRFEVSCYTGKVGVVQGANDKVEITSGEKCYAGKLREKLQLKTFDPGLSKPEWTQGKFTFDDQPLSVVFSELERQYDVKVKLAPGIGDLRYTGLFESGNLDTAVYLITWPLHLQSEINGKNISISR